MKEEYLNQSVQKAMQIMDAISHSPRGMSLAEVCRTTGLQKTVAYRMLITLEKGGWLARSVQDHNKYQIGLKVLSMNTHAMDNIYLKEMIFPDMQKLLDISGETVVLVMFSDGHAICVEKIECDTSVRISAQVGKRFPLHAGATGLSVLMGMPDALIHRTLSKQPLERFSKYTLISVEQVIGLISRARKEGFIMSSGTVDDDVAAIGVPLPFPQEHIYMGLSVIGPSYRMDEGKKALIIAKLLEVQDKYANI